MLTDEDIEKCREKATASYKRHYYSTRGQQVTAADDPEMHLIWEVIAACEAKLREQEPVAWMYKNKNTDDVYLRWTAPDESFKPTPLFEHPAPIPEGWISVNDRLPKVGRTPILVAVSWVKYGEHEDGTPTEATGVDVTEGEYIPAHGEAGGYFDSYQGSHGDSQYITHWQTLPKPPTAAARSGE